MEFITNRTSADVARAAQLNKKVYDSFASLTAAELDEWRAGLKGAYNYTDLNRVETAVAELSDALAMGLSTKTNWTMSDVPDQRQMDRYFANLKAIKAGYGATTIIPISMSGLNYDGANSIELMLNEVYLAKTTSDIWEKYPAELVYGWYYTRQSNHSAIDTTGTDYQWSDYSNKMYAVPALSFDRRFGFSNLPSGLSFADAVGCYFITDDGCEARRITSASYTGSTRVINGVTHYEIRYDYTIADYATREMRNYCVTAGGPIGRIMVTKGSLPAGELIEGSYAAGECYTKDGNIYYYYSRIGGG